mgnify:CR=1 FL=1
MAQFKELEPLPLNGGVQYLAKFENGYGASIVQHNFSFENEKGLWELAVIFFDGDDFEISYNTPITDDVLGWLTEEQVDETLEKIKNLNEYGNSF